MNLHLLYLALVFGAGVGLLQFTFDFCNYRYGLVFRNIIVNRFASLTLLMPAVVVFFNWNAWFPVGVVEGAEQAGLFALGVGAAVAFCLGVSSFVNRGIRPGEDSSAEGLNVLRVMTFYQAVRRKQKR